MDKAKINNNKVVVFPKPSQPYFNKDQQQQSRQNILLSVIRSHHHKSDTLQLLFMSSAQRGLGPLVKSAKYNLLVQFNQ